jgi:hypothetical protein
VKSRGERDQFPVSSYLERGPGLIRAKISKRAHKSLILQYCYQPLPTSGDVGGVGDKHLERPTGKTSKLKLHLDWLLSMVEWTLELAIGHCNPE